MYWDGFEQFNFRAQTAAKFTCADLHANEIICKWCSNVSSTYIL